MGASLASAGMIVRSLGRLGRVGRPLNLDVRHSMTVLTVRNSLWKNAVLAFIFALGAIPAALMAAHVVTRWSIAAAGFFSLGLVLFLYRAVDRRPRVIIDASGITDFRTSIGPIPWSEVSRTQVRYLGRVDQISLSFLHPDIWMKKLPPLWRFWWGVLPEKWHFFSISLQNMDVPTSDVAECLQDIPAAKLQ